MKFANARRMLAEIELYQSELYMRFSEHEKDIELRRILIELSKEDSNHAMLWGAKAQDLHKKRVGNLRFRVMLLLRKTLGLELAIKLIDYKEYEIKAKIKKQCPPRDIAEADRIIKYEESKEGRLKSRILSRNKILANVRDVVFGMNDGLVEILAATAGIGAAIQQPYLVLISGSIVAISGTLSMAGGAYLSTEYQNTIEKKENVKNKWHSPKSSAAYVGVAYIFGALFPLLPFIFGMYGYAAIAMSVAITAVVLIITSAIISIVSDTPIIERISKTLAITLGIALITIVIGAAARHYLKISV